MDQGACITKKYVKTKTQRGPPHTLPPNLLLNLNSSILNVKTKVKTTNSNNNPNTVFIVWSVKRFKQTALIHAAPPFHWCVLSLPAKKKGGNYGKSKKKKKRWGGNNE